MSCDTTLTSLSLCLHTILISNNSNDSEAVVSVSCIYMLLVFVCCDLPNVSNHPGTIFVGLFFHSRETLRVRIKPLFIHGLLLVILVIEVFILRVSADDVQVVVFWVLVHLTATQTHFKGLPRLRLPGAVVKADL